MESEHRCYRHGPHFGAVCPHCERLDAFERARREDERRDEDREWKRQEEQRERDAREAELRAEEEEEAWRRHSDALEVQERIAAQAEARARHAASGVLRASELARSALIALEVGDTKTALAQVEEALNTAPTYAWGHLARALIVRRTGTEPIGPLLERAVALALAGGDLALEPLPVGMRGPCKGAGDPLAYALAHFERDADTAARTLLASGRVSEAASFALSACIPGYAQQLVEQVLRAETPRLQDALCLQLPTPGHRAFAARWAPNTWTERLRPVFDAPAHERWRAAESMRAWRAEWATRVVSEIGAELAPLEQEARYHAAAVTEPPSLATYAAHAASKEWPGMFAVIGQAMRASLAILVAPVVALPLVCCTGSYFVRLAPRGYESVAYFGAPILAALLAVVAVVIVTATPFVKHARAKRAAATAYPAFLAQARAARSDQEARLARLAELRRWYTEARGVVE